MPLTIELGSPEWLRDECPVGIYQLRIVVNNLLDKRLRDRSIAPHQSLLLLLFLQKRQGWPASFGAPDPSGERTAVFGHFQQEISSRGGRAMDYTDRDTSTGIRMGDRASDVRALDGLVDSELLRQFAKRRDPDVFRVIVLRHGPLVMKVCRVVLRDTHSAEDAYQETFLLLAEKAKTIRRRSSLASWLHGTAYRVALRSLEKRKRRQVSEERVSLEMVADEKVPDLLTREEEWALHEAVHLLPERYRAPILLCYWEGKAREEAAAELGCTVSAVKGRLETARRRLRVQLAGRGSLGAICPLLIRPTEALVPETVMASTVELVLNSTSNGWSCGSYLSLSQSGFKMSTTIKHVAASTLITVGLLAIGLLFSHRAIANDRGSGGKIPPGVVLVDDEEVSETPEIGRTWFIAHASEDGNFARVDESGRELVSRSLANQGWTSRFWARVTVDSRLEYPDDRPSQQRVESTIRRDGERIDILGRRLFLPDKGELSEEQKRFRDFEFRLVSDGKWWLTRNTRLDQQPDHGGRSANIKKHLISAVESMEHGGALDGYTYGADGLRIAELLRAAPAVAVDRTEEINGFTCQVVTADTRYGAVTAWIDPSSGFAMRKFVVEKEPSDIFYEGRPLSDFGEFAKSNLVGWSTTLDDVSVKRFGKYYVPTAGILRTRFELEGDQDAVSESTITRTALLLEPVFADEAFKMDFVQGARVSDFDNRGTAYIWNDGEMLPEMPN